MAFRLLSDFELYLEQALPKILSIPKDMVSFELSNTPEQEVNQYVLSLSGKKINKTYQRLFDFVRGSAFETMFEQSKPPLHVSDCDAHFQSLSKMSLLEISSEEILKRVCLYLLEIRRQKKTQALNEKDTLALLPKAAVKFWNELSDEGEVVLKTSAQSVMVTAEKQGGISNLILADAKPEDTSVVDKVWVVHQKALLRDDDGFCVLLRLCYDDEDESVDSSSPFEVSIHCSNITYKFESYDYFEHAQVTCYPTDSFQQTLAIDLCETLLQKHLHLGRSGLNAAELELLPLAKFLFSLPTSYNAFTIVNIINSIKLTPQLEASIRELSSETKDKYFDGVLRSIQKYNQDPSSTNLYLLRNKIKYYTVILKTVKGRLPLRWILQKFQMASQAYPPAPMPSKFIGDAITKWRESITKRLLSDGFSGDHPHFRRQGKPRHAELISISEMYSSLSDTLSIYMTAGTAKLDKHNCLGKSIPFADITAYDCQYSDGWGKERYRIWGAAQNIYTVNNLPDGAQYAKNHLAAWDEFEIHLNQIYRFLSGKKLDKAYRNQYRMKDDFRNEALAILYKTQIVGFVLVLLIWLLSLFISGAIVHSPYYKVLFDLSMILWIFGGGIVIGAILGIYYIIAVRWFPREAKNLQQLLGLLRKRG